MMTSKMAICFNMLGSIIKEMLRAI